MFFDVKILITLALSGLQRTLENKKNVHDFFICEINAMFLIFYKSSTNLSQTY